MRAEAAGAPGSGLNGGVQLKAPGLYYQGGSVL